MPHDTQRWTFFRGYTMLNPALSKQATGSIGVSARSLHSRGLHLAKQGCHKAGLSRADAPHDGDQLPRPNTDTDVVQPPRGGALLLVALLCCRIVCKLLQRHISQVYTIFSTIVPHNIASLVVLQTWSHDNSLVRSPWKV